MDFSVHGIRNSEWSFFTDRGLGTKIRFIFANWKDPSNKDLEI
jgi:hypothetical protein